jgi:hypothetical protein
MANEIVPGRPVPPPRFHAWTAKAADYQCRLDLLITKHEVLRILKRLGMEPMLDGWGRDRP